MELTEPVENINKQLVNLFGIDTITSLPIWRIVFSEDQFEKRKMTHTDEGLQLLYPQVREVPKYRQWIHRKYVLERLTIIPEINMDELPVNILSYEPLYVFEDKKGNPLPPKIEAAKYIIDTIYAAMGKSNLTKYVDPDNNSDEARQNAIERVDKLEEEIFGQRSEERDALNPVSIGYRKVKES